jgi:hypothetical protein
VSSKRRFIYRIGWLFHDKENAAYERIVSVWNPMTARPRDPSAANSSRKILIAQLDGLSVSRKVEILTRSICSNHLRIELL